MDAMGKVMKKAFGDNDEEVKRKLSELAAIIETAVAEALDFSRGD